MVKDDGWGRRAGKKEEKRRRRRWAVAGSFSVLGWLTESRRGSGSERKAEKNGRRKRRKSEEK